MSDDRAPKLIPWTPDGNYVAGDLVEFPEHMIPPGEPRIWRVADVDPTKTKWADGYMWEKPRLGVYH